MMLTPLNEFPSSLLEKIFIQGNIRDIVNLSKVCKKFNHVINYPSFFLRKIEELKENRQYLSFAKFIGKHLKSVSLKHQSDFNFDDKSLEDLVSRCPNIESAAFHYYRLTNKSILLLTQLKNLKELTIQNCDSIDDEGLEPLLKMESLTVCNFERCIRIREEGENLKKLSSKIPTKINGFIGYE